MAAPPVTVKLEGIEAVRRTLQELPQAITGKNGGPARRALRRGMAVMRKAARANLALHKDTGLLQKALTVSVIRRLPSGFKGEGVRLRVRRVIYPNKFVKGGTKLATNDTAWWLEYGSSKQPATPWLLPAYNAMALPSVRKAEDSLVADIDKIAADLLRRSG